MLFSFFFFKQKTAYEIKECDWSSDVCSSDLCLKCSHTFNLLDARGAISVTERTSFIHRVRNLCRAAAEAYVAQREAMGYPLMGKNLLSEQKGLE